MTLRVVSLLAPNVDEAAADLAGYLTEQGLDAVFDPVPHSRRLEVVGAGEADIVWLCGRLALQLDTSLYDLIAAPWFIGEESTTYRSVVIGREPSAGLGDLCHPGVLWALNEPDSWSGHHALSAECDLRGISPPTEIVWSGSHLDSIRMVRDGAADAAAIDSTLWRWANVGEPDVVDVTRRWPAPPILVRRELLSRSVGLSRSVTGASTLRGVDHLESADWHHLDALSEGDHR